MILLERRLVEDCVTRLGLFDEDERSPEPEGTILAHFIEGLRDKRGVILPEECPDFN